MTYDYTQDRIELQDVMLQYAAAVDERDVDRYKSCFRDDVEVVGFGTQTYRGRDAWVDYVWSALDKYQATQHLLGPQFAIIEGDEAQSRTIDAYAMNDYLSLLKLKAKYDPRDRFRHSFHIPAAR